MHDVAILADDLTGALDAAAAFARPLEPVTVGWKVMSGPRIAIDSETRAVAPTAAREKTKSLVPALAASRIALKKVDSLLRGNTFAEIAACCESGAFDAVFVAPAFPEQGRRVLNGRLVMDEPDFTPISISDGLLQEGIAAVRLPRGAQPPNAGVFVCDGRSSEDLRALVDAVGVSRPRTLWCGSAGLAYALSKGREESRQAAPTLWIIGSRHQLSRDGAGRLREGLGARCIEAKDPRRIEEAADAVAGFMNRRRPAALVFDLTELSPHDAETCYRRAFLRLAETAVAPISVAVVGGDTVFRLAEAVRATSLRVLGDRSPGIPTSQIEGGIWHGVFIVSKSGAFHDDGLFSDLVREELKGA